VENNFKTSKTGHQVVNVLFKFLFVVIMKLKNNLVCKDNLISTMILSFAPICGD